MKTTKIPEGLTNQYLVHALASLTLAFIAFHYSNLLAFIFVIIALVFFFVVTGFEINFENYKYRKYSVFLGFVTIGKWEFFSKNDAFHLMLSSETSTIKTPILFAPTNFYNGRTSKLITFDIVLINNEKREIVNAFIKYNSAKKMLMSFHKAGFEARNRIAEKIADNKNRG